MVVMTFLLGALLAGAIGAAGNLQLLVQQADRIIPGR